jgi:hypothetical protein
MANDYSFSAPAPGASHSNVKPLFEGNDIYDVVFNGCVSKDVVGKKDETMTYKTLVISFGNEDGYFTHTIFEPKKEDFSRPTTDIMGNPLKFPKPSNVETMMLLFKHLIDAVNPEVAKKIDSEELSLGAKDWDEMRNKVIEFTEPVKGKVHTSIKLLKGKNGPTFPFFTSLTREGKAYVNNNIIGNKLFFSSYEKQRISVAQNAPKTQAYDLNVSDNSTNSMELLNFDVKDI